MNAERVQQEIELIRRWYGDVNYLVDELFVHLPYYRLPKGVWRQDEAEVGFFVKPDHPDQGPYPFFVRPNLVLADGSAPENYTYPAQTPLGQDWGQFSWQLEDWRPAVDPRQGSNLLEFARSIWNRLEQGR